MEAALFAPGDPSIFPALLPASEGGIGGKGSGSDARAGLLAVGELAAMDTGLTCAWAASYAPGWRVKMEDAFTAFDLPLPGGE